VLALTNEHDWVLDPFSGVGSAILAALRHNRKGIGCEKERQYVDAAKQRIADFRNGTLPYRPLGKPVHQPTGREKVSQVPREWLDLQDEPR
jgi:adenine-specific DNA-methyltransferase